MILNEISKIIEYIEDNYNSSLSKEVIEETTGMSEGYFRNEFKKVVKIPLDKYRIRRELTLIIDDIINSGLPINQNNILPWTATNSFYKAFKSEFKMTPNEYIKKYKDIDKLQSKVDLKMYEEDEALIKELTYTNGSEINALRYLLTLKPYLREGFSMLFCTTYDEMYERLIKKRYGYSLGKRFYIGDIPKNYYKKYLSELKKYYCIEKGVFFDTNSDDSYMNFIPNIPRYLYIIVKRSIIRKLFEKINIEEFIDSIKLNEIKTIWYEFSKFEKIHDGSIAMPNELIEATNLSEMKRQLLEKLVVQEQGVKNYDLLENLRKDIEYNYDKHINNFKDLCNLCGYKEECKIDEECRYLDEMSEDEEKEFYNKPDYEVLKIEELKKELLELMLMGIVYLG